MSKKESTFMNMLITLFVVAFISSASLGFIYEITKGPIAASLLEKKIKAIKNVLPAFNNNPISDKYIVSAGNGKLIFYPAKKNGKLVGTAIETFSNEGFGGTINLIVGFLPDGTIYDTAVINHKETPGLGDKMDKKKSNFSMQFKNKNPDKFKLYVKKDGGDVDAITAATISSRAFCDALRRAYKADMKEISK